MDGLINCTAMQASKEKDKQITSKPTKGKREMIQIMAQLWVDWARGRKDAKRSNKNSITRKLNEPRKNAERMQ